MTISAVILGVFEVAVLSILTGCLVTLAIMSHIVEWIFVIVNPTIKFFLHQVNDLILLLIILMARLTSSVVAGMFPCQETNSSNCIPDVDELSHRDTAERISSPDEQELLDQLREEIDTEVLLADLCTKVPFLQSVLRPEYTPYLNTAGTVILGWIVVAWISNLIWALIAPLTISALAVAMVCPTTVKWVLRQVAPNQELVMSKFVESLQAVIPDC